MVDIVRVTFTIELGHEEPTGRFNSCRTILTGVCQVRVVCDQHSDLEGGPAGVADQMRGQVDEPFSSVLSTHTRLVGVTPVSAIETEWVKKCPYVIDRFGIVRSARR